MGGLGSVIKRLVCTNRKALFSFLSVGNPNSDITLKCLNVLAENGADALELGAPFSDPIADGKTIRGVSDSSVRRRTTITSTFGMGKLFKRHNPNVPTVLMSYANLVRRLGPNNFLMQSETSGIESVILVDCPTEMVGSLCAPLKASRMRPVLLTSPSTPKRRLISAVKQMSGYLYFVSTQGTTGTELLGTDGLREGAQFLLDATPVPVLIGFGIRSRSNTRTISKFSDGTIVGTLLVGLMESGLSNQKTIKLGRSLKQLVLGLVGFEPTTT
ncbi:tryptophan synthase subunit alpha [Candidatus Tremblaya phenacola PAVE]|nr:tryptophan synthase subunit alpha [Candidatus Tremblaya phenacola PAVE]